jgi:hypothetical protein
MIQPLGKSFTFQFIDEIKNDKFIDKSSAGLILSNPTFDDQTLSRWVKIVSVGKDVTKVKPNDIVLLKKLKWTQSFKEDLNSEKLWKSDEDQVLSISTNDDELVQY